MLRQVKSDSANRVVHLWSPAQVSVDRAYHKILRAVKGGGPPRYVRSMLRGQKGQQEAPERGGVALEGNLCFRTATGSGLLPPTALFSNSNRQGVTKPP